MTSHPRPETVARLYDRLPRVYRVRDEQGDGALRQLVEVIAGQIEVLAESIDQSYDDHFIETAADWVVPYIGDLIGYRPLSDAAAGILAPRAEVANTIAYRRRKGTAAMLEQLAVDVTGWKARAVEFFEHLSVTQFMNHVRPGRGGPPDLRPPAPLEWIAADAGAFDETAHIADVRRVATGTGRYNLPNVGIFLWRLAALRMARVPVVADGASTRRFRFHPLGIDQPLFAVARAEDEITHIAQPLDVPLPMSRRFLAANLDALYGKDRSVLVGLPGEASPPTVKVCDLSDVAGDWAHAPAPGSGTVAIDPVLGRVYFPDPVPGGGTAISTYTYGSAFDIGGGGYGRDPAATDGPVQTVTAGGDLAAALGMVTGGGAVEIADNWRYPLSGSPTLTVAANADQTVVLRSADRCRPLLDLSSGPVMLAPGERGIVILDGLLVSGGPLVLDAATDVEVRTVILRHCTLVPGLTRTPDNQPVSPASPSLVVRNPFAIVVVERCVLGPIAAVDGATVTLTDSIVDASSPAGIAYDDGSATTAGAALTLDQCTVVGRMHASELSASNSILYAERPDADPWPAPVRATRRQVGCVRFSYVPDGSRTARPYRCQPAGSTVRPAFTSLRYGDPGYAQLRPACPDQIRRGADNESEMGAGNYQYAPQREANLRQRLDEYLRFGLEAGIFYAT
jgi:hypothetical protein